MPRSVLLIAVWIWRRCLSYISRWRVDMFRLWRRFLVRTNRCLFLRVGLRWRIFDFVLHVQFPSNSETGSPHIRSVDALHLVCDTGRETIPRGENGPGELRRRLHHRSNVRRRRLATSSATWSTSAITPYVLAAHVLAAQAADLIARLAGAFYPKAPRPMGAGHLP